MDDDIDRILDNIEKLEQPSNEALEASPTVEVSPIRERLIAVAASGNAQQYLGKHITTSKIENLEEKEVRKLYSRYEAYIGGEMTKSMKSAICKTYTTLMGVLIPSASKGKYMLDEGERLSEKLIENPVVNLALSTYTCNLYHSYGHYLAPLTATLLTSGHIKGAPTEQPAVIPAECSDT